MGNAEFMFMLETFGQTSTHEGKVNKLLNELKSRPHMYDTLIDKFDEELTEYDWNRIDKAMEGIEWELEIRTVGQFTKR